MIRFITIASALTICAFAAAGESRSVDLRDPQALAQLQKANPAHFAKVRQILADLQEQPQRAESDWLQVNYNAQGVLLQGVIKTSYPPKQFLYFKLDDVRYTMWLVRSDMTATLVPAR